MGENGGVKTNYFRIVGDRGISFEKAMEVHNKAVEGGEPTETGFYRGKYGATRSVLL